MKRFFLILTMIFATQILLSTNYKVQSYVDKTKLGLKDQLSFTIEISGNSANDLSRPNLPNIQNFNLVGQNESQSQSYSIVNGKMSANISFKYIYYLRPEKEGTYVIPEVKANIEGRTYRTKPIQVIVVDGTTSKLQQYQKPNKYGKKKEQTRLNSSEFSENIFAETKLSKKSAYIGEVIVADIIFYTRYNVTNIQYGDPPAYTQFWKEELYSADRLEFEGAVHHGVRYNKILLQSVALIPTKTGELKIPQVSFDVDIRQRTNDFFSFGTTKKYTIVADKKTINVKELPTPQPKDFTGAIGRFTLQSDLSNDHLKVGDSFTYTMIINGSGNIKNFESPLLPEIENLRFIKPEIKTDIDKSYKSISGKKIIKYLVIPEEQGNFYIPSINFTYFSPTQKKYITLNSPPQKVTAIPGETVNYSSGVAKNRVTAEGQDITFINTSSSLANFRNPFESIFYWIVYILAIISIPISLLSASKQAELYNNESLLRNKKANKILKKYLKKATVSANLYKPDFYTFAQLGLKNFITDKLNIPRGTSSQDIFESISKDDKYNSVLHDFKEFYEHCDQVRFMPDGFSKDNISQDYAQLTTLVKFLSKGK